MEKNIFCFLGMSHVIKEENSYCLFQVWREHLKKKKRPNLSGILKILILV